MDPLIQLIGVQKNFGLKPVLKGVDLTIQRGETLSLLGGSGCGKSVLLKHIIGLLSPDEGQVIVEGEDISRYREEQFLSVRKKISMVFQSSALFDSLNVFDNVAYPLREHTPLAPEEIRRITLEKLSLVGLREDAAPLMPAELSGGMRRRVGLARALALEPSTVLYDEPTTGLDPISRRRILGLIQSLHQRLQNTSIVVTHDVDLAFTVADRVAFLHDGRIAALGSPPELIDHPLPALRLFLQDYLEERNRVP